MTLLLNVKGTEASVWTKWSLIFRPLYYFCLSKESFLFAFFFSVASEISEHPSDVTAVEGQRVVLSCLVKGNPSPSVRWTKNEERLNVTANSRLTVSQANNNHSLIVKDVRRSDAGQYRCVANNRIDNSTSSAARLVVFCEY